VWTRGVKENNEGDWSVEKENEMGREGVEKGDVR
jgi:hypothetical protein